MLNADLRRFDRVVSTQDVCRALAQADAPEGVIILADEQTGGRGRAGHTWHSPPGQAIYASILLRPPLTLPQVSWITMIAALAVVDTIIAVGATLAVAPCAVAPTIKWFNDVMLGDKKVCGILVETASTGDRLDYAILGMGLNVNTDFARAPDDVQTRATSLRACWGADCDRTHVCDILLTQFARRYESLCRTRQSPAPDYARQLNTLGKQVRLQAGAEILEGHAHAIDALGGLCLQTAQGERIVHFGHVLQAV